MAAQFSSPQPRLSLASVIGSLAMPLGLVVLLGVWWAPISDVVVIALGGVEKGYIFLVPFVAAYLSMVRRSADFGSRGVGSKFIGVAFAVAAVFVAVIGQDRDILAAWHAAPILCFWGLLISTRGTAWCRVRLAPLFLLMAMVPVPGTVRLLVSQPLQGLATGITGWLLAEFGVPLEHAGNVIEIRGVQVAVGEACDGMRLVMPLAIVMYAFVFALPLRGGTRVRILIMCVPIALLCNVARLVPTALAYGFAPSHAAWIHDLGGWAMIPMSIAFLVGLLRLLEWLDLPVAKFRLSLT